MKIFQYNAITQEISSCKPQGKIDLSKGNQVIVMKINSNTKTQNVVEITFGKSEIDSLILTKKEAQKLIQYCGYNNLQMQKVFVYTPKLFLLGQMEENRKNVFLKLGESYFVGENNQVRELSQVDTLLKYGKYFEPENILVWEER